MTRYSWPLESNRIRREVRNNAFGMVRNGGTKAHQGWDLSAMLLTRCYAIADGVIETAGFSKSYGKWVALKFQHETLGTLYAVYCHLAFLEVDRHLPVKQNDVIGHTGITGNASNLPIEDRHLHFEIRTTPAPMPGLTGRIDPALLYGRAPIHMTFFDGHGHQPSTAGGTGLKVPGVNVLK